MDVDKTVRALEKSGQTKYVKFVSEKSSNRCPKCQQYDGKIYAEDDPRKPPLPLHPNCRCKYVSHSSQNTNEKSSSWSKAISKIKNLFSNAPDATKTTLEMKYLPTGVGELIGGVQIASITVTDYGIWAERAKTVVSKYCEKSNTDPLEILLEIKEHLAKGRIRDILIIHNRYQHLLEELEKQKK